VSAASLLGFYTALLRNWAITYSRRLPEKEPLDVEAACLQAFVKHVGTQCLMVFQVTSSQLAAPEKKLKRNALANDGHDAGSS
jgi:hypothetical protein